MKLTVNLATRPFVELRPLLLRMRVAMAALLLLAAGMATAVHVMDSHAAADSAAMHALEAKTHALQTERAEDERSMQQPTNAALLEQSRFLNGLFTEKAFSWTAVMMDLETVLPGGVQVTSIDPQIDKAGAVTLRLRVSGNRDKAVEFVENLETSDHFRYARLADESTQTSEQIGVRNVAAVMPGAVEFNILVEYNPLPLHVADAGAQMESDADAGTATHEAVKRDAAKSNVAKRPAKHAAKAQEGRAR